MKGERSLDRFEVFARLGELDPALVLYAVLGEAVSVRSVHVTYDH